MLGYSIEPEMAAQRTREKVAEGFTAVKWFPLWGPTDGRDGMRRNIALAETLREAAGPDVDIMLDAWMSWNKPYTLEFARRHPLPGLPSSDPAAHTRRTSPLTCPLSHRGDAKVVLGTGAPLSIARLRRMIPLRHRSALLFPPSRDI